MTDIEDVNCVFQILREGRLEVVWSLSGEIAGAGELPPDCTGIVHFDRNGDEVKLLGLRIPLGNVRAEVVDSERFMKAVREAYAQAAATGNAVTLRIEDLHVIEEYLDWLPGKLP